MNKQWKKPKRPKSPPWVVFPKDEEQQCFPMYPGGPCGCEKCRKPMEMGNE